MSTPSFCRWVASDASTPARLRSHVGGGLSLLALLGCQEVVRQPEQASSTLVVPDEEQDELYIVQQGDTLYGIAKRHYGDGNLWPEIERANSQAFAESTQLSVGQPLRLPPLQTLTRDAPSGNDPWGASTTPGPEEPSDVELPAAYTIQSGDTLYGVAKRHYGSGDEAYIDLILEANRESITDVRDISIGVTLSIPAPPANLFTADPSPADSSPADSEASPADSEAGLPSGPARP